MIDIKIREKMFEMSGKQRIKIDEDTIFEKPIKTNGYEANNMAELHELMACDVITSEKYNELVALLEMGEIGVIKQRKKYKELYEEEKSRANGFLRDYKQVCEVINEIYDKTNDIEILKIIDKVRH